MQFSKITRSVLESNQKFYHSYGNFPIAISLNDLVTLMMLHSSISADDIHLEVLDNYEFSVLGQHYWYLKACMSPKNLLKGSALNIENQILNN